MHHMSSYPLFYNSKLESKHLGSARRSKVAGPPTALSSQLMDAVEAALMAYESIRGDDLQTEVNSMPFSGKLIID